MAGDIQIIDSERQSLDFANLRRLMGWSWGDAGEWIADLWQEFNQRHWQGTLDPTPIWFPSASPYGRWIGQFTGNMQRQSHHIQLVRRLDRQERADVLLHEMIHQNLFESKQCTDHNAVPWCSEIMRLSREIWGVELWAAPSNPRKLEGASVRIQKSCPDNGKKSIPRSSIARWPHSVGLHVPVSDYSLL